ncbi:MAG TPA: flagellar FlbD family protein [Candidatus Ozemobacteraceae bacterium]|nr:flagellar FlbD family protein [Candidatus Ozemobacteraceae bacterium]
MIRLTRINGRPFVLNADLIENLESTPDTVITLMNGRTYMVRESLDAVLELVIRYRRSVFRRLPRTGRGPAPENPSA